LLLNAETCRAQLENLHQAVERWGLWLAAAVLGGAVAAAGFTAFKHTTAAYPDFIVGYITIDANGKAGEYVAAFGFMVGMAVAFYALAHILNRISRHANTSIAETFYMRLLIAVAPAILWGTTSLWPQADRIGFYWAAVALVSFTLLGALIAVRRPNVWLSPEDARLIAVVEGAILVPLACILAVHGVAMIGNKVGAAFQTYLVIDTGPLYLAVAVAAGLGAALVCVIGFASKTADRAVAALRTIIVVLQVPAFGLCLVAFPLPSWTQDLGVHYPSPVTAPNWILQGVLFVVGCVDLARLWRNAASPTAVVSALTLIAVIVYARTPVPAPFPMPIDDYHAAENFAPWWAAVKHGMLPLWDFSPARGLINYQSGALAALFTDSTAAGLLATQQLRILFLVLLVFPPLALALGKWPAFLILSFATLDEGPGGIDTIMGAGLALLCWGWLKLARVPWLILWFVVGLIAVLLAPGQGGVLVLATMPAGLWQLYHAMHENRRQVFRSGGLVLAMTSILLLATPLGLMVLGAIRYGIGQSSVNGIANGIPWRFGTQTLINSSIFEVLRFSWLAVGAVAIVITLWAWSSEKAASDKSPQRSVAIFAGTTVVLLCIIFIARSIVRLDAGFVGRPGWMSIWALTLLLPILISYALPARLRVKALMASVALGSMLTPNFGLVGIEFMYNRPVLLRFTPPADQDIARGDALGLPNLGDVILEKSHAERLKTINAQLNQLLEPHETFLDLTNNGAQYFYFDRPPPSESTAAYNLITPAQQLRTVETLVAKNVPVALIGPHTVPIDGLRANLRSHLVYRHLLLNFVAVSLGGYDYLIRTDRLDRTRDTFGDALHIADDLAMLHRNFPFEHAGNLARAYGRSADDLNQRSRQVHSLDPATAHWTGASRAEDGTFAVQGQPVTVAFDLSSLNLAGRAAGVLKFDLVCEDKSKKWVMDISWTDRDPKYAQSVRLNARNGTHILPLDAAPGWLLAPHLDTLTLKIGDGIFCQRFQLSNVKLLQRADADAVDQLSRTP
jgi:hypothetical protein